MTNQTIEQYINAYPEDIRVILRKIRQTIRKAALQAVETLSYRIPTFDLNGRHLVHFAAFRLTYQNAPRRLQ